MEHLPDVLRRLALGHVGDILALAGEVHQPPDLEDVDEATNRRL